MMAQLMKHMGPPTLARVGAVGASFFVAGVVQTYAAITSSKWILRWACFFVSSRYV